MKFPLPEILESITDVDDSSLDIVGCLPELSLNCMILQSCFVEVEFCYFKMSVKPYYCTKSCLHTCTKAGIELQTYFGGRQSFSGNLTRLWN